MSDIPKLYISAQQLLEDSVELARQVLLSDFKPDYIVGVWRGGTPVGIAVQEMLDYYDIKTDHISIRTSSYETMARREASVRVHGLTYLTRQMETEDSLLIVDDVFDTGLSVKAIIDKLRKRSRKNMPADVRVATAYYKPLRNKTDFQPDYYAHETDAWLVFPHEMDGLSREEILVNKPYLSETVKDLDRKLGNP